MKIQQSYLLVAVLIVGLLPVTSKEAKDVFCYVWDCEISKLEWLLVRQNIPLVC